MSEKQTDLEKAMRVSVIEGIYAQIHSTLTAIGSVFITKAAVVLNASPMHFSILAGITQLCQFFQLYAVHHNKGIVSRKKPTVWFAFWGRLLSVLLGVSFAITQQHLAFLFFLGVLFISQSLLTISGNMWIAWMSDLIPRRIRGRFFSRRMQIHLLFGLMIGYLFSFLIDLFEATPDSWRHDLLLRFSIENICVPANIPITLSVIFIIGAVFGLYGLRLLMKQPERSIKSTNVEKFDIFEPLRNSDFRKLMRFGIWWMFAIGIGSAFWGPFMLRVLKMSLVEMQLYTMLSALGMLFSFRLWGKFIDKFGNKTAMKIGIVLGSINPVLWIFLTETNYTLIFVEAFTSGVMWSGANLIAFNFVLSIAPRGKEQHWSAVYSAIGGMVMLSTILLSGIFYPKPLTLWGYTLHPEQVLFLLTGVLRLSAEIPLHFVHEPRSVGLRKTVDIATDIMIVKLIRFRDRMFKIFNF
jgi:MFS family permease